MAIVSLISFFKVTAQHFLHFKKEKFWKWKLMWKKMLHKCQDISTFHPTETKYFDIVKLKCVIVACRDAFLRKSVFTWAALVPHCSYYSSVPWSLSPEHAGITQQTHSMIHSDTMSSTWWFTLKSLDKKQIKWMVSNKSFLWQVWHFQ